MEVDIQTILKCYPARDWSKIDKAVRLRGENILFKDIENGNYDTVNDGALGTWINIGHLTQFNDKDSVTYMLTTKLQSNNHLKYSMYSNII